MQVSIIMLTYNHEKFIQQAIESVLAQKTDFEFELVISDDCSIDRTFEIISHYKARYPKEIRVHKHQTNVGPHKNYDLTIKSCQSKYIAILDGDDYWISENKLQTQFDLLESSENLSMCFHNVYRLDEKTSKILGLCTPLNTKDILSIEDLILSNPIYASSVMMRSDVLNIPDWLSQLPMGDWPVYILLAQQGDIGYIDEVLSVYRIHTDSIWSSQSHRIQIEKCIVMLNFIKDYISPKYLVHIDRSLSSFYNYLSFIARQDSIKHLNCIQNDLILKFGLREVNLIIFPDWRQDEALLFDEIKDVIISTAANSNLSSTTILVDSKGQSFKYVKDAIHNICLSVFLESKENFNWQDLEISVLPWLHNLEWELLLPSLNGYIEIKYQNSSSLMSLGLDPISLRVSMY